MAKRAIEVDEDEIQAADARLSKQVDDEVRARLEGTPMIDADKVRLEAAEKNATAAAKEAADLKTESAALKQRLESLEACAKDAKTLREGDQKLADQETLRRATFLAEQRGVPKERLEGEAKRLAGLGRSAVDEILQATPAPRADPLLTTRVRREGAPKAIEYVARRLEEHPDGSAPTLVLTVQDWSHYDSRLNADGSMKRGA